MNKESNKTDPKKGSTGGVRKHNASPTRAKRKFNKAGKGTHSHVDKVKRSGIDHPAAKQFSGNGVKKKKPLKNSGRMK